MNADQDIAWARSGTPLARPTPPHTFMLDGHLLRQLRRRRGLSQEELADQAGISLTTVARLERQLRAPLSGLDPWPPRQSRRRRPRNHDPPAPQ